MNINKYKIASVPDWVVSSEYNLHQATDTPSPFFYYLVDYQELVENQRISQYKRTIEHINDASRIEDASLYITELDETNHQVIFHTIDIIRNGERIDVLKENAISINQRETSLESHITDRRITISVSIDDLRVGDIVDYRATHIITSGEHPLRGKYYHEIYRLNWECPVFSQHVIIINQSTNNILAQYCLLKSGEYSTKNITIDKKQTFSEQCTDLVSFPIEDGAPYWLWPNTLVTTTESTWLDLSSYLFGFYDSQGIMPNNIDPNDIPEISLGSDISDNIISVVRFVQNEIRYKGENHGIFTHTPKDPSLTLKKRYGDCKDKSNLLVALLRYLNISAHLTLVNTNYGLKISRLNPSPYHFNHMIVHIRHNGNDYYFDPTIKKQAGNLENCASLDYGYGLILSNEGETLKKLPHSISNDVFSLKHIIDFTETSNSVGTLTILRTFYAHRANNMRYHFDSNNHNKIEKDYFESTIEETELDLISIKPLTIVEDDTTSNTLKTEEIYAISKLPSADKDQQIHIPTRIHQEFPTSRNQNLPLRIDLDGRVTHHIEAIYKEAPSESSETKSIENKWFSYQDSITTKGNTIYLVASAVPLKQHVDCVDLGEYQKYVEEVRLRSMNNLPTASPSVGQYNKLGTNMFIAAAILALMTAIIQELI